jgi:hypothetical protein
MTSHDGASFDAGQDAGTRISACVTRLAALQLVEESRWWNRWRLRIMARALLACADELEDTADAACGQGGAHPARELIAGRGHGSDHVRAAWSRPPCLPPIGTGHADDAVLVAVEGGRAPVASST